MGTTHATRISLKVGLTQFIGDVEAHPQHTHLPGDVSSRLVDLCIDTGLTTDQLPQNLRKLLDEAKVRDHFGRQTNQFQKYLANNLLHELNVALKTVE